MEEKKFTAVQRHDEITKYLSIHETISVMTISNLFHVTTETARKDLQELERQGIAIRFHGGAKLSKAYQSEPMLEYRNLKEQDKKWKIAYKAESMITQGSKVLIDSGSTTYGIMEVLDLNKKPMIITNSVPIITHLAQKDVGLLLIGGEVVSSDMSTGGAWVEACLKNIYADVAFIGASGLSNPMGPGVEDFVSADVKRVMLSRAEKKYIVADSSKLTSSSLVQFIDWNKVDGLIIDNEMDERCVAMMKERTNLIIAE